MRRGRRPGRIGEQRLPRPRAARSGLSVAGEQSGRQPGLGRGKWCLGEVPGWGRGPSRVKDSSHRDRTTWLLQRETHRLYRLKLEELTKLQNNCTSSITRQKKQLQELALVLKKCKPSLPSEAEKAAQELENQIKERQGLFFDMEAYLPKQNGFAYKDEYEKFKLYLTIILILISFTCRFLLNSRVTDAAFNFLLVWYYCTLTIRESILINNGSR
eukprot:bmy_17498T0